MKNFFQLKLLLIFLSVFLSNKSSFADGIVFFAGSWEQALEETKKSNKLLFIDAYAEWCGPCKFMSNNVFPDKSVGDFYNTNFIAYKIDVDDEKGGEIFSKYGGTAMPTYLFLDGDGNLIYKQLGSVDVEEFISIGKKALSMPQLKMKYAKGELNAAEKIEYWLVMDGDPNFKEDVVKYLKTQSDLLREENYQLLVAYIDSAEDEHFQYFLENLGKFKAVNGQMALTFYGKIFENEFEKAVKTKNRSTVESMLNYLDVLSDLLPPDKNAAEFKKQLLDTLDKQIKQ